MSLRNSSKVYIIFSGGSRGGSWDSNEPTLEPKLFHFHGEFQKKNGQTAQIEPLSANLNPRSKNPGSAPDITRKQCKWCLMFNFRAILP